ncbi:MAG: aldehyde dehydrogenase family protein [Acidimicrobiales bacterium]
MRKYRLLIGGEFVEGAELAPATSPSSGEDFASIPMASAAQAGAAVEAARRAFPAWAGLSPFDRAEVLTAAAAAVTLRRDELARALTEDQGKPLVAEAYDEVDELAVYLSMAGEDAKRLSGQVPPSTSAGRRVIVSRVPLGVIGVVTPWNWPYTMGAEIFAPALAAGNTVVWAPPATTAACTALLAEVLHDAFSAYGDSENGGLSGVFNFVTGEGPVVGDAVVGHQAVAGVGFVGSVLTGALVAARASGRAQVLELGGNGPLIVLEDADLELAATAALEAAYLCAGQSCTAGERFLVHRDVRAEFVERVVEATRQHVRLGDPFDDHTTMGPLNNEPVAAKFEAHVTQAADSGARICTGGYRASGFPTRLFCEPTVLDGVTPDMLIAREETFGPVVPVIEISSAAEALERANTGGYGLTTAVFTADLARALAFAEAASFGWVNINASTNLWESHLPFGGRAGSLSGIGRVGGASVMEAFTEPKTIVYPAPVLTPPPL